MAAGDRNAGLGADRRPARENVPHRLDRQLAERHAEDGQGEDRLAAHGIDVRQRIGGGDSAEIAGIVDHRHEEIGGGDDAGLVVHLPDRGVVAGLGADQQGREGRRLRLPGQQLLQNRRGQLAATAAAMGQVGQTESIGIHNKTFTIVIAPSAA